MTVKSSELTHKIVEMLQELKQEIPETINNFLHLSALSLKDGVIEGRIKSMIALAIAITQNSKACMVFHLQNLIRQKLAYNELIEIISIATYMGGGVALAAATDALEFYQQSNQINQPEEQTYNAFDAAKGYGG